MTFQILYSFIKRGCTIFRSKIHQPLYSIYLPLHTTERKDNLKNKTERRGRILHHVLTCVVLPQPVSPLITITWFSFITFSTSYNIQHIRYFSLVFFKSFLYHHHVFIRGVKWRKHVLWSVLYNFRRIFN